MAFLRNAVVAERDSRLRQLIEELGLVDLLGGLKGYLNVAASEGKVVSLPSVLLKEEGDLAVALLLQIADDGAAAQLATTQDLSYFGQILLLEGALEEIVRVINGVGLDLTLACQGIESITHELSVRGQTRKL